MEAALLAINPWPTGEVRSQVVTYIAHVDGLHVWSYLYLEQVRSWLSGIYHRRNLGSGQPDVVSEIP